MDLLGERVAGGLSERPGGGAGGVVPERERGVEVLGLDLGVRRRAARRVSASRMVCASARAVSCPASPSAGWVSCG